MTTIVTVSMLFGGIIGLVVGLAFCYWLTDGFSEEWDEL